MTTKALKKQLMAAIAMVVVAAVALTSATYAWFVNNTQVTATDVTVTATTASSLQIKHYASGNYGTTTALNTANIKLVPVSTVGGTGPASFYRSNEWDKDANVKSFIEATVTNTNNATDSNLTSDTESLYYVDTVYFKAGQTSKLYFDADSTGLVSKEASGVQTTLTKFSDSTNELVKAMRIGVLVSKPDGSEGEFFVYQLNDTASTNAGNTTATTGLTAASANGLSAGVTSATDTAAFTNTNIVTYDTTNSTLPTLDTQTVDGDPDAIKTEVAAAIKPLYDFSVTGSSTTDKTECKAVIYIWMEGCDYDTVASNTTSFADFANKIQLGFCLGTPAA